MKSASLNHAYRLVWSDIHQAFVAVAEFATAKGKGSGRAAAVATVVLSSAALAAGPSSSLPTGGNVVAGTGSISQSGNTLTINQSSNKLAVDWQNFSVGTGKTVNFVQPSSDSVALNRVLGSDVSVIQGSINANGQVFLVNPNGVLFTPSAQVNVGSIVASTLNISTADFMAGNYRFTGAASNAIINQGNIQTIAGGTIALIAARIENVGQLTAPQGNVLMGAGQKVRLDLGGPVKIEVEAGALNAVIEQSGGIRADGGLVYLTAKAAGDLASAAINQTGLIEARTVATGQQGKIYLMADMDKGSVKVAGTLDASAPNGGNGGFIETSAAKVKVADGVNVTTAAPSGQTGTWLIDPNDFTIAASGGDISGGTLSSTLLRNSVVVESTRGATSGNGDIFVNDAVTWSTPSTLTLSAQRNIAINAPISAGVVGGRVQLEYGQGAVAAGNTASYTFGVGGKINLQAGNNFLTKLGSDGSTDTWKVITSLGAAGSINGTDLQGMNGNLSGKYVLGADIDATATKLWNNGAGFLPIGSNNDRFTGSLNGLGHTISGLTINRPSTDYVGLFGYAIHATLQNIGLVGGTVSGKNDVGGLAGLSIFSTISNSYTTGTVSGTTYVGGLVGENDYSTVSNSYATGAVSGSTIVGGLVGYNSPSTVSNSYATGNVSGATYVGGLVGYNYSSTVSNSYATGNVSGATNVGGLLGGGVLLLPSAIVSGTPPAAKPLAMGVWVKQLQNSQTPPRLPRGIHPSGR
jgi:filamentous hemagglutinin family protein